MKRRWALAGLVVGLALTACRSAPPSRPDAVSDLSARGLTGKGVVHTVAPGQTLWRIAQTYGVPVQQLAEVNDLEDPSKIRVGQGLWIPGAEKALAVAPPEAAAKQTAATTDVPARPPAKSAPASDRVQTRKERFIWPVKGTVFSRFGVRDGAPHDGIDISAPSGSPIVAADAGEVLYAGVQRGYGNIVLIKHGDGLITIYAHNRENKVKAGERVKRGQVIATVGQTGRASGPHLHFEVREQRVPRNPLFFLP